MAVATMTIIGRLALAIALSAAIGIEREARHKRAGLRTNTLIGVGAAVAMMVSKYGFADVISPGRVVLDPSRVAAQIVSGIGFVGAGIIFVRRDSVHGLTTAAVTWLTAMVGMACGAGLLLLAVIATVGHLGVVIGFAAVEQHIPVRRPVHRLDVRCESLAVGAVVAAIGDAGGTVEAMSVEQAEPPRADGEAMAVHLDLHGRLAVAELVAKVSALAGVSKVAIGGDDDGSDG
jgi:putative Mg2+ transporter-C (MgtC) family protein